MHNKFRYFFLLGTLIHFLKAIFLQSITGVEVGNWDRPEYLFRSLVVTISKGQMECTGNDTRVSKALRVTLPDQHHSYFVTESEEAALKSCCVTSISFRYEFGVLDVLN